MLRLKKNMRRTRLDRRIESMTFDLDLIDKAFRKSLLMAELFRKPGRYLRGRSGAPR